MAKLKIFAFLLIILLSSGALALTTIIIDTPKDKSRTEDIKVFLRGQIEGGNELSINKTRVLLEKGGLFEAVALLKLGKNLISFSAGPVTKTIRVLKTESYSDLDTLYSGRPHWCKAAAIPLGTMGVIEGYPDGTFLPEQDITRGEIATWLARAKRLKVFTPKGDVFYDVPKEHWRAPYIKAVADAKLMSADPADRFGIDLPIKRYEAVEIFAKAFGFTPSSVRSPFKDVPANADYAMYLNAAYLNKLVIGLPGKPRVFEPERNMKRGEASVMVAGLKSMRSLKVAMNDFSTGFTPDRSCEIGVKPEIKSATIDPGQAAADGRPVKITADVRDTDLSQVWVDLTPVKGFNNSKMTPEKDTIFSLTFSLTSEVSEGEKEIKIFALDKTGLKSESDVILVVTGTKK